MQEVPKNKRGRGVTAIDPRLNEILFKLWMTGKTLDELVSLYENTPQEFSASALYRATLQYCWKDRREKILKKVREGVDEEIEIFTTEKIKTLHHMMLLTSDVVNQEYQEYLKNPHDIKRRPSWLPSSVKDIDILYRLHDFVVSGGAEKHLIGVKNADKMLATPLPDQVAVEMLKLLADTSTKELLSYSESIIDAEFSEAHKDDEEKISSQVLDIIDKDTNGSESKD